MNDMRKKRIAKIVATKNKQPRWLLLTLVLHMLSTVILLPAGYASLVLLLPVWLVAILPRCPFYISCLMGGKGSRAALVNKTSHTNYDILKQKIKQSFSTITLCLISLVENVTSLHLHLLQVNYKESDWLLL